MRFGTTVVSWDGLRRISFYVVDGFGFLMHVEDEVCEMVEDGVGSPEIN